MTSEQSMQEHIAQAIFASLHPTLEWDLLRGSSQMGFLAAASAAIAAIAALAETETKDD